MSKIFLILLILGWTASSVCSQEFTSGTIVEKVKEIMPDAIREHRELVSIPNDSNFPEDMERNVDWIKSAFEKRGFTVNVLQTPTIPVIIADLVINETLPTVLFYIHYDGQPVDGSKWDQEHPFIPVIKGVKDGRPLIIPYGNEDKWDQEWRIYARAAADDKGPLIMFLKALDVMDEVNFKPVYNIKLVLDGEEERGSAGLKFSLEKYRSQYSADRMIIMDGPAHPTNIPTLTFGCRGTAGSTLTIYGPRTAQHSGHYGNYAPNPAFLAARLLASMKDDDGKVSIKGFYDGIELDEGTMNILNTVPDDEEFIKKQIGIAKSDLGGLRYQESLQYPSLNIKGMVAGWIGKQTRTIIPDKVVMQLGIRLVVETDGERMLDLVEGHINSQGFYVINREPTEEERLKYPRIATFIRRTPTNAFRTELDSPIGLWLSRAILKVHERDPVRIRTMGGTVPITPMIEALGIPAVIVPMVNMDNNQHSPNENLRVGNLFNGILTCIGIFTEAI